jgi:cytochrome P450
MASPAAPTQVPSASKGDTAKVMTDIVVPLLARGVIIRRPRATGLAQRVDADRRAVRRMQRLHETYGPGPLLLDVPRRDVAVILSPHDVRRVLRESPEPFAAANLEKRAALSQFQPHGVLISHGAERADRRRFNEVVLDDELPIHHLAGAILAKVADETGRLVETIRGSGRLTWDDYITAWYRMVRRVVLGDAARDDHALTDLLAELRGSANWSYLTRTRGRTRDRFLRQLQGHLDRAEPGSLAAAMAETASTRRTDPAQQVPQWLFAFDAAAWASFRALALVAAHPEAAARARDEVAGRDLTAPHGLPYLRSCVLDSLRLYPTTPAVLRDTTTETSWETGTLPAGSGVLIFAPFFHRDDRQLSYAHRFAPEVWLDRVSPDERLGTLTDDDWPLIPFSAGPVVCPGRNLVLLTTSTMLGALLSETDLRLDQPTLDSQELPGTLSPFAPEFAVG